MNITEVQTLIGSLGFPIVCCIILIVFGYKLFTRLVEQMDSDRESHQDEVKQLTECINNNTQVLNKLVVLMENNRVS